MIQGTGAACIKIAYVNFYNICRERGWLFKVLFDLQVYDEMNTEAPIEIAREVADIQAQCMREAGDNFTSVLHLDVDENIADHWVH